jgi:hypothetical protein
MSRNVLGATGIAHDDNRGWRTEIPRLFNLAGALFRWMCRKSVQRWGESAGRRIQKPWTKPLLARARRCRSVVGSLTPERS